MENQDHIKVSKDEVTTRPNDYDLGEYIRSLFHSPKKYVMQIQKETVKTAFEKVKQFLSALSKVAIVILAMATGFAAGNLYYRYTNSLQAKTMQKARTQEETSIAINERGEIMVIDRKSGFYEVYSDTVGKMIFDLYASKMYYSTKK